MISSLPDFNLTQRQDFCRHVKASLEADQNKRQAEGNGIEPSAVTPARLSRPLCHLGATFHESGTHLFQPSKNTLRIWHILMRTF
jgi:hypothetical protein